MALSRASAPIIRSGFPRASTLAADHQRLWAPYYANRQTQLGNTATLVNFGDPNAGAVDAATFTGKKFHASGLSPVWTPTAALSALTTPTVPSNPASWQVDAIKAVLDGASEGMETPDVAYFTRALAAFSIGLWVNLKTQNTEDSLMSKWQGSYYASESSAREWHLNSDSDGRLIFKVQDETGSANLNIRTYAALNTLTLGTPQFVVCTYDGGTAASGLNIYVDGALISSTDVNDGVFVSMQNTAAVVCIGYRYSAAAAKDGFADGTIYGGPFCPFFVQAELTAAQVANLYAVERLGVGV